MRTRTSTTAASSATAPITLQVPYDDYWYLIVDSYDRVKNVAVAQLFDD